MLKSVPTGMVELLNSPLYDEVYENAALPKFVFNTVAGGIDTGSSTVETQGYIVLISVFFKDNTGILGIGQHYIPIGGHHYMKGHHLCVKR